MRLSLSTFSNLSVSNSLFCGFFVHVVRFVIGVDNGKGNEGVDTCVERMGTASVEEFGRKAHSDSVMWVREGKRV